MNATVLPLGDDVAWMAARIASLHARSTQLKYQLLTCIREFDIADGWRRDGATSCTVWLETHLKMGAVQAREHVRVAHALGVHDAIDTALSDGSMSYSQARAVTRVATADNETELVALAADHTAAQLEKRCSQIRREQADTGVTPEFEPERRFVSMAETEYGMVRISAQLHPEEAATVMAAIERAGTTPTSFDRADGLVALAGRAENDHAPAVDMLVRVDADTLTGRSRKPGVMGSTLVSAETARRLLCNAAVIPFRVDADSGDVLDIGRRSRVIPPKMRIAMLARDNFTCRFPGCSHTTFLDGHHVIHWENDGRTTLDNVVTLCTAHHRTVHEYGFYVEHHDGDFVFFDPQGDAVG